jgi:hypothetical protein
MKLAGGATVIAGASVIHSSPAFALTVNPVAPTVTVGTTSSEKAATFTLGQANPTCGGSATDPASRVSTFTASVSTTPTPARTVAVTPTSGSTPLTPTATVSASFAANNVKFEPGDTARIEITTTFSCEYVAGTGTACRIYTFDFTYNGPAKNFLADLGSPSTEDC